MVSRNFALLSMVVTCMILMTLTIESSVSPPLTSIDAEYQPSALDIQDLLPDPDMDTVPHVLTRGTSGEFSTSFTPSGVPNSYVSLQWSHTAGTNLDWYNGIDINLPDCEDFIYLTQEFTWDIAELPNDAFLNLTLSVTRTGDFDTENGALMFKIYAWLIDSSGNWELIYRSYPPYSEDIDVRLADLNYFNLHNAWGGMIEDDDGVQDDPADTLTFAIGLAPTDRFLEYEGNSPWAIYNGMVYANIYSANLYSFMVVDPDPDEILFPLANETWGRKTSDIFPNAPSQYDDVTDLCNGIATGEDSSVYVLVHSICDYLFYIDTGQSFQYTTVLKYDSQMNLIWVQNHDNLTIGTDIFVKGGYIYTVGYVNVDETYDVYVSKWDSNGNIIWTTTWDSGVNEIGASIGVADDGAVYVYAQVNNDNFPIGPYFQGTALLKYDSNGGLDWNITLDEQSWPLFLGIEVSPNGLFTSNGYVLTYRDFLGVEQWEKTCESFTVDSEGNLYSALTYYTNTGRGIQFNKTNSNGILQWTTNYTISYPGGWDALLGCVSLSVAHDGTLIAHIGNWRLSLDHYLVKFSPDGVYQWHKIISDRNWSPPNSGSAFMSVAPNGIAYVAFTTYGLDIAVYSFDVGVFSFSIPVELPLIAIAGFGIIAVSILLIKKRPRKDFYSEYKEKYEL